MSRPLLFGVGITDLPTTNGDGKLKHSYKTWARILERCFSEKKQATCPQYIGTKLAKEWETYSNFEKWYETNYVSGWELDKDILSLKDKIYSPETCLYVPKEINCLSLSRERDRGDYPLGVRKNRKRFGAEISLKGKVHRLGTYASIQEAFDTYVNAKRLYVAVIVEQHPLTDFVKRKVIEFAEYKLSEAAKEFNLTLNNTTK